MAIRGPAKAPVQTQADTPKTQVLGCLTRALDSSGLRKILPDFGLRPIHRYFLTLLLWLKIKSCSTGYPKREGGVKRPGTARPGAE